CNVREVISDDYGWRWGEPVEGGRNNVKCKFCERVIKGGITRLKDHLRRKEELEGRIRLGDHGDYGDSDADDEEFTIARRGSSSETQVFSRSFGIHNSEKSGREHQ
ncbi:hypothetical protein Gotur_009733, partial [Gossypium turneri]